MTSIRADQRVDSGAGDSVQLYEASATADQGLWDITVAGGVLKIRTRTDKDGDGVDLLSITRAGTAGTIIALAAALVPSAADDTEAAALDPVVPIGGLYRTASAVKIRVA